MTEENKAIAERFIDEFYGKGTMDIFDELLAPDFFSQGWLQRSRAMSRS